MTAQKKLMSLSLSPSMQEKTPQEYRSTHEIYGAGPGGRDKAGAASTVPQRKEHCA